MKIILIFVSVSDVDNLRIESSERGREGGRHYFNFILQL